MATLSIKLLGPFQVFLDEQPITKFESDRVRALLAYLAVEADRPHRREHLAGMLWPNWPQRSARTNLRRALSNLRKVIGDAQAEPSYLEVTRQSIQFNAASDVQVDAQIISNVASFNQAEETNIRDLEKAIAHYQGEFLEGFTVADSVAFEEWAVLTRERLGRLVRKGLQTLAERFEALGDYPQALDNVRRLLELEPLLEEAHRSLMRLLAISGERSAAIAQYEACKQLLEEELGLEPSLETKQLFNKINSGEIIATDESEASRSIRGYSLREHLGTGRFGEVYKAYQNQLGRDVVIRIIPAQYANHPEFIRYFEREALRIAQLEHPHIVPLYDYWREPDGAYLVTRWINGASMWDAMKKETWQPKKISLLFNQITSALFAAHQQGIVHGDLNPGNILIDDEGNAQLIDFGIGTNREGLVGIENDGKSSESPQYLAPETVDGLTVTNLSDIYSLGVILFEMFSGENLKEVRSLEGLQEKGIMPKLQKFRGDVPAAVDDVIDRAMAEASEDRYPDASALSRALQNAIAEDTSVPHKPAEPKLTGVKNPYKGLLPFFEVDEKDFFGRDALIEKLVNHLIKGSSNGRFLALVGPSGSGKSSVIRAGLIPALRRGKVAGSEDWYVIQMLPGEHPLEELETALLRIAVNPPDQLLQQMQVDERGMARAVKRSLPDDASELLLFIDQFEELFTLVRDEAERDHFLQSIFAAIQDGRSRLRVVLTLRADFYDRPLLYPEFGVLLHENMETVMPLSPAELENAIAGPLANVGVGLEPGLAAQIAADFTDEPGALPLLQFALTEVFDNRQNHTLTFNAYHAVNGVSGALGSSAERVYQELENIGKDAAKQLFLRLVTVGEGIEVTRRRVLQSEMQSLAKSMPDVMEAFGEVRLLSFDRDPITRGPTVEVAHEALLREWPRLRKWLDENRADLRLQNVLAAAASEWRESNHDVSFLLRGSRVDQFEGWRATTRIKLSNDEVEFLEASLASRNARRITEEAQRKKELDAARKLAEAESKRAEEQTNTSIRLRRLAVSLGFILLVALVASVFAFQQSRIAEAESRLASANELASASIANLENDPELSILLALEAVAATFDVGEGVTKEAQNALHQAIQTSRTRFTVSREGYFEFSGAQKFDLFGPVLVVPEGDGRILVYDPASWNLQFRMEGHRGEVIATIPLPSGRVIAVGDTNGALRVWDYFDLARKFVEEGFQIDLSQTDSQGELFILSGHRGAITSMSFDVEESLLATSSIDDTVKVWDLDARIEIITLEGHNADVNGVTLHPDGLHIATASEDQTAKLWDIATGTEVANFTGHTGSVLDLRFNSDGTQIATASGDGTAILWDAQTSERLITFRGHSGSVRAVDFVVDGSYLATGGEDATARIWNIQTGAEIVVLQGHKAPIYRIGDVLSLGLVATSSLDGSTRYWEFRPERNREWLTLIGHSEVVFDVAYGPDGKHLATASWDGTAIIWGAILGSKQFVLAGHSAEVSSVEFDPEGQRVATSSFDGTVRLWDTADGKQVMSIDAHPGRIHDVIFNALGTRLVSAGEDGMIKIWDASTGDELDSWEASSRLLNRLALSPDGTQLVSAGGDGIAKVWDFSTGNLLLTLTGHSAEVLNVSYSPDGARIATAGGDGLAKVWDATTGDELLTLVGHGTSVWTAAFSPDGTRIATMSLDKTAKLWDANTGEELLTLFDYNDGRDLSFSPNGEHLAVAGGDGAVRIYILPIEDLVDLAQLRVTRDLTNEECQRYLHVAECPSDVAQR